MRFLLSLIIAILLLCPAIGVSQDDEILILQPEQDTKPAARTTGESRESIRLPETDVSNQMYLDFYDIWRQFELQLKLGSVDTALIQDLLRSRNRNGIPKMSEFAISAVRFGQQRMADGKPEEALQLFTSAVSLDPTLSIAYYSQARAMMASSWLNVPAAIPIAISGMFAPLHNLSGRIYLISKYVFIITATLLILGWAFALTLLAKYYRLLRHDMMERYTSMTSNAVGLVMWAILFLPVFLLAGLLWLAPFWLMIFWKYARTSERILSVIFFLAFMIAYPVYQYGVRLTAASVEPTIAPFIRVFTDGPSPRLLADFREYSVNNSQDSDATIMLAHLYRADRNYLEAIKILQKHTIDQPNDARAYNNLGHIYFFQGETDIGLRMVQKAEGLDGRNSIYPYNLSILQRAKFNFSDAEESLAKARQLDPDFVRKMEENPYSTLVDSIPSESMIFSRIEKQVGKFEDYFFNPFTAFSGLLLILAFIRGYRVSKKKNQAKECIKCGRPFCKRCQPAAKELRFCTQCLHIFVKKDGVSPASRKDKMREIEDYSRRQEVFLRISSLILPGFGNLYRNRVWFGTILLFFWFLFLVLIVYNWRFAPVSFYESPGSTTVLLPVVLLFLALLYMVANISLFRNVKA
jgi:tetratricopeptide (TPR) repeat protein